MIKARRKRRALAYMLMISSEEIAATSLLRSLRYRSCLLIEQGFCFLLQFLKIFAFLDHNKKNEYVHQELQQDPYYSIFLSSSVSR